MSPTKRLSRWAAPAAAARWAASAPAARWAASAPAARWAASAALAGLLAAGPIAAAQGEPGPGNQGSPPPQIDSYQPFPAAWDQPITIHGSHLVPWQDPSTPVQAQPGLSESGFKKAIAALLPKYVIEAGTSGPSGPSVAVPEGPKPVLKVGSVSDKPGFVIPASDIESWTSTEIHIKKLSGGWAGAYWIAIYQNGKRVSNLNRTLLFPETDPNATYTLAPWNPSDSEDDEPPQLTIDYAPVQEPSQPLAWVHSYQPTGAGASFQPAPVGAGDEVQINGGFPAPGNFRLFVGAGNKPLGMIKPQSIKEWSTYKIRFENCCLPTGVYWIAVFDVSNGLELVSNLEWSLQVTEDPPPPPPGNNPGQLVGGIKNLPLLNPGGSSPNPGGTSGLQRLPATPGTGAAVKTLLPRPSVQRAPRVKILQPVAEPGRGPGRALERKALEVKNQPQPASRTSTAPMAPVPEKAPERTLRPVGKQPSLHRQPVR